MQNIYFGICIWQSWAVLGNFLIKACDSVVINEVFHIFAECQVNTLFLLVSADTIRYYQALNVNLKNTMDDGDLTAKPKVILVCTGLAHHAEVSYLFHIVKP